MSRSRLKRTFLLHLQNETALYTGINRIVTGKNILPGFITGIGAVPKAKRAYNGQSARKCNDLKRPREIFSFSWNVLIKDGHLAPGATLVFAHKLNRQPCVPTWTTHTVQSHSLTKILLQQRSTIVRCRAVYFRSYHHRLPEGGSPMRKLIGILIIAAAILGYQANLSAAQKKESIKAANAEVKEKGAKKAKGVMETAKQKAEKVKGSAEKKETKAEKIAKQKTEKPTKAAEAKKKEAKAITEKAVKGAETKKEKAKAISERSAKGAEAKKEKAKTMTEKAPKGTEAKTEKVNAEPITKEPSLPLEKKSAGEKPAAADGDEVVGKTEEGKQVYEGSRGGHYYLNEKGDKVYVNEFVGAKIVGKTPGGKTIFEGPRGGHFYYNDKGDKVYVKKQ